MTDSENLAPNLSVGVLSTLDTPSCLPSGMTQDLKGTISEELFSRTAYQTIVKEPAKPQKKTRKRKPHIVFNVSDTKYDVVKYVGKELFGWKLSFDSDGDWDVFWTDSAVVPETLARMDPYQKINHFPCMYSLARKNHLGRYLMRMRKAFPDKYRFFPRTFLLPTEYMDFRAQFNRKISTFIVKPEASCQGRGIFLTRTFESIEPGEHYVVQKYIEKPYLIDGLKFDLRVYVLLAGCDPLRIYVFNDGLARFATEKYQHPSGKNLSNMCMHLTNYAINKGNPNFIFNTSENNDSEGHKRSLKALFRILESQGKDTKKVWKEIKKLIIKTFCSVQPILAHTYKACQPDDPYNNMCFEILGFDIMLDHELKPWLIEVNHTPSFTTDTPLDRNIKANVIKDALTLMNVSLDSKSQYKKNHKRDFRKRVLTGKTSRVSAEERQADFERAQKERDEWESSHLGGFQKIFPVEDPSQEEENYDDYLKESNRWWEEWTGIANKRKAQKEKEQQAGKDPTGKPLPTISVRGASPNATVGKPTERSREYQTPLLPKPKTEERIRRPVSQQAPARNHMFRQDRGSISGARKSETMNLTGEPQGGAISTEWSGKDQDIALSFRDIKSDTRNFNTEGDDQTPTRNVSDNNVYVVAEDYEEMSSAKDTIQHDEFLTRSRSKTCVKQLLEVTHSNLIYTRSASKVNGGGDLPDQQSLRDQFNKQFFLKQPSYRVKIPDSSAREPRELSNEGKLTFNRKSKDIMNLIRIKLTTANPSYGRTSVDVVHRNIDFGDAVNQSKQNSATRAAIRHDPNSFMKKIKEPSGLGHVRSYLTKRRPSIKPVSKQNSFLIPGQPAVVTQQKQRPQSVLKTAKISIGPPPEDEDSKETHSSFSIQGYRAVSRGQKGKEVSVRGISANLLHSLAHSRERFAMQKLIEN